MKTRFLSTFDGVKDVFNAILVNTIDQITLIENNISDSRNKEVVSKLDRIDGKNEYFSQLLRAVLLKGILLPINKHDLQQSIEKFEAVIDLLQRLSHHLWLTELPSWINNHLKQMSRIAREQLTDLNNWFTLSKGSIEQLDSISDLENKADDLHRTFLKELYSIEIAFKEFHQATKLDQTLEDIIDNVEILSRQIHIILNEYRTSLQPLPKYLP